MWPTKILFLKDDPGAARYRLDAHLAAAKLSAPASLFLVASLNFRTLGNCFFVRDLGRMQCNFNTVTLLKLFDHCLNVKLSRTSEQKLFCLRVAAEMKRLVFLQDLM